jgi:hypothetical protein
MGALDLLIFLLTSWEDERLPVPYQSFYSILFYSILFYSILFYSILFYSILFYSILFYSIFIDSRGLTKNIFTKDRMKEKSKQSTFIA